MVSFTIVSRKAEPLKNIVENLQSKLQQKTGDGTSEADPLQTGDVLVMLQYITSQISGNNVSGTNSNNK